MKGFTLLELIIVITIIGTLTVVSWSIFVKLQPSLELNSIVRNLTTDLRYAQQLAVSEQVNHGVRFSTSTDSYIIMRYGTSTTELLEKLLPQGIIFQEITGFSNNEVIFNSYGSVQEIGTISLLNTVGETKTIAVRPSGFVKIE